MPDNNKAIHKFLEPAENAARMYWRSSDSVYKGVNPIVKSMLQMNLEYAAFTMRQTREAMDLGTRMSQCKSPVDAAGCAMNYWMSAFEELAKVNGRAMSAFGAGLPVARPPVEARIDDWSAQFSRTMASAQPDERTRDRMDLWPATKPADRPAPADHRNVAQAA